MNIVFECSVARTGSQLLKNILKQNKDLAIQSDSPLHSRFVNFRDGFKMEYGSVTIDSEQLTKSFNSFWLEGLKGWGKSINPKAKVYIEHSRNWADDIYTIINSFKCKIIIVIRDIKDVVNSLDTIAKKYPELNTDLQKIYTYKHTSQFQRMLKYLEADLIRVPLTAIKTIIEEDLFKNVHFVKYEDLVKTPQKELDKLYKFLELKSYKHDFENIKSLDRIDTPFMPWGKHSVHTSYSTFKKEKRQLNDDVINFIDKEFKWYYDQFYKE